MSQLIRTKKDYADRKTQLDSAQERIKNIKAAIEEAKEKIKEIKYDYDRRDEEELKDRNLRLTEAKRIYLTAKDRLERLDIRSPVKGIVNQLHTRTIGSSVPPNGEIVTIVPIADTLIIDAQVQPQDIGFIKPNDSASIKVTAFDYSIYGSLKGHVVSISPDTVQEGKDVNQRVYYLVKVRTDINYLSRHGQKYIIIPGMTVQVDIFTGHKTIMQYIFKPLIKTISESMGER